LLDELIAQHGVVSRTEWQSSCVQNSGVSDAPLLKSRQTAFRRIYKALIAEGVIVDDELGISRPDVRP
jgi:hypothetical protein